MGDVDSRESYAHVKTEYIYGKSLYILLNFAVKLELL